MKNKHNITIFILVLILAITAVFLPYSAQSEDNSYTWKKGEDGTLTILNLSGKGVVLPDFLNDNLPEWYHDDAKFYTSIKLVNAVEIGNYSFYGLENVESITFSVTNNKYRLVRIGNFAFEGCKELSGFEIPKTVTEIGIQAFSGCTSIAKFEVDEENNKYAALDGVLYTKDKITLIAYPLASDADKYEVNEYTETIAGGAFCCAKGLKEIILPESLKTIQNAAFKGAGISEIIIPKSVINIAPDAFDSGVKIFGYKNTEAQRYAKDKNLEFVALDEEIAETTTQKPTTETNTTKVLTTALETTTVIPETACQHDYKEIKKVAPTCTKQGYTEYQCSKCNAKFKADKIEATGHNYKQQTRVENGYEIVEEICSNCGDVKLISKNKISENSTIATTAQNITECPHEYEAKEIIPPTCTKQGYTNYVCKLCGAEIKGDKIPASGHKYKKVSRIEGNLEYIDKVCSVCGKTIADTVNKLPTESIADTQTKPQNIEETATFPKETEHKIENPQYLTGDVNLDGAIKVNDARLVLRAALNMVKLTDEQIRLADINGDERIKTTDARYILRMALGLPVN